jgi:hypothetical protein
MNRPQYEVADIIKIFGQRFCEECQPNEYQKRVLNALLLCRTTALGGHKEKCDCCAKERISYNSCRNRHCPKCQGSKQAFWVEDLLDATMQVKHYHIVFTVPHELNHICLLDSKWFYEMLFASVWETIHQFGYNRNGVESGAICVLHSWGQNLSFHPHIHCIVPAVGESFAGNIKHIGSGGKYLYPVKQLSGVFRGKLMQKIKERQKTRLLDEHQSLIKGVWEKSWVVYCEPSMAKPEHVIRYLGQYTHRVAISNQRIIKINDRNVTFMHKDYSDGARLKPITLDGVEFLRRFCMHILPHRFVKIRRYGIYSSRARALKKSQGNPKMTINVRAIETAQQRLKRITGFDVNLCPFCKQGNMYRIEEMPRIRYPTGIYSQAGAGQI